MRTCDLDDCERKHYGTGLCKKHYLRQYKYGDVNKTHVPTFGMSNEEKFWHYTKKSEECWEWQGPTNHGYGYIRIDGPKRYMHRFSWELHNGEITDGLFVLHKCDNPSCVNPDHLFLGTQRDNVYDCIAKGRHVNQKKTER